MDSSSKESCWSLQGTAKFTTTAVDSVFNVLLAVHLDIYPYNMNQQDALFTINTFAASYLNTQGFNNSCLKSPASTVVDLTFQSLALRSFNLNQLRNLSL